MAEYQAVAKELAIVTSLADLMEKKPNRTIIVYQERYDTALRGRFKKGVELIHLGHEGLEMIADENEGMFGLKNIAKKTDYLASLGTLVLPTNTTNRQGRPDLFHLTPDSLYNDDNILSYFWKGLTDREIGYLLDRGIELELVRFKHPKKK